MPPAYRIYTHSDRCTRITAYAKATIMANSIEDLAVKMKIPVEAFKATVRRYHKLAHMGRDLDFGKRPDRLFPINRLPYYAG
jgi:fumarate reductase flavoprotein subunit